jgi:hypothetical protein
MRLIGSLFVILAAIFVAPPVRANEAELVHVWTPPVLQSWSDHHEFIDYQGNDGEN